MLQSFSLKYFHQIVAAAPRQHQASHTGKCELKQTNQRLRHFQLTNQSRGSNPIQDDTWKTVLTSYSFEKFVSK